MNGLFGSTIMEVAVGIALVYLLLAIFCTVVNEWIASVLKARSGTLEKGLRRLLAGQDRPADAGTGAATKLVDAFYGHPLIASLTHGGTHPSYVTARSFAGVIMDLVTPDNPGSISFGDLEAGIKKLPAGNVKTTLLALIQNVNGDLGRAQAAIEGWFNDSMARVSGAYKRRTQVWTLVVASLLAILTNADTIQVTRRLWMEPALRNAMAESAQARAVRGSTAKPDGADLAQMAQLFGWQGENDWSAEAWAERVLGWILTICAVSLGAPFWFDTLNRFVNIRATGRAPGEMAGL